MKAEMEGARSMQIRCMAMLLYLSGAFALPGLYAQENTPQENAPQAEQVAEQIAEQGSEIANGPRFGLSVYDLEHNIFDLSVYNGWAGHSLRSKRIIDSVQFLGARLLQAGHEAFGLQREKLWGGRLLYWLLAGYADSRIQFAVGTVWGHELAHMQAAHASIARLPHLTGKFFLVNSQNGRPVGVVEGALWMMLNPVYLAASAWQLRSDKELTKKEVEDLKAYFAVESNIGQGVNFSTWIGAERAASLAWRAQSVFGFSGLLWNYFATAGYAAFDALIAPVDMDIARSAELIRSRTGKGVSTEGILGVSLLSPLLSPTIWSYIYGLVQYFKTGETRLEMLGFSHDSLFISWDMPTYLNHDSVSLRPMLFSRWGKRILLGTGLELGVLGKPELNVLFDIRFIVENFDISVQSAFSLSDAHLFRAGVFLRPALRYHIREWAFANLKFQLALEVEALFTVGKTLRGKRLNPHGRAVYDIGLSVVF